MANDHPTLAFTIRENHSMEFTIDSGISISLFEVDGYYPPSITFTAHSDKDVPDLHNYQRFRLTGIQAKHLGNMLLKAAAEEWPKTICRDHGADGAIYHITNPPNDLPPRERRGDGSYKD